MLHRVSNAFLSSAATAFIAFGLLAAADVALAARVGDIDGVLVVQVFSTYALVALGVAIPLTLLRAVTPEREEGDRDPSPANPITLLGFAALGSLMVLLNRGTFEGAGLQRTGRATLVEGGVMAALLLGLFVVCHVQATRAAWPRAMSLRWVIVLIVGGALAHAADRAAYRGQYPQVHLQLFLAGGLAWMAALWLLAPREKGVAAPIRATVALLGVVVAGAALVLARTEASGATLSRLARTPYLGMGHALELTTPLIDRFVPDRPAADVDAAAFFASDAIDPEATGRRAREAMGLVKPPNVVIVSVDTVRADHVGFLGYERPTTPRWDEIAAESTVFTRAYTTYPTSHYAFSSMFTSRFAEECPQRSPDRPWPETLALAGMLTASGWDTMAATAFLPKQIETGGPFATFKRGFRSFEALGLPKREANADIVTERVLPWIEEMATREDPTLLWVHFFDPHAEYVLHPDHDFGTTRMDRYDSEIAHADAALGRVWDAMRRTGLADRSILIVHSDHGESFGEHNTDFHNSSLFNEQIRVPLTVRLPGLSGRRLDETVSIADLLPTLLSLLGVKDRQPDLRRGRDLSSRLLGDEPPEDDRPYAFSQLLSDFFPSGRRHALIIDGIKVINTPRGFPRWEVYDTRADEGELLNVFGENPERDARLAALLEHLRDSAGR